MEDTAKKLVELLKEKGLKIASAESCTGGLFAKLITDVPGSSVVLDESYVTYANEAKTKILGVKKETLEKYGAVSEQTVYEMVSGLYKVSKSDVCVVFSGIAGPDGGTEEKPVGTVFSALSINGEITTYKSLFKGSRDEVRHSACFEMIERIMSLVN
ncbi:MAG: CinA family protein [Clostridia bacterium]|nr:CinA family protein [Clostridia bacterium]